MRNILLILLLVTVKAVVFSQNDTLNLISSWKIDYNGLDTKKADIDTSLENFQIYNPLFKNSFSNSTLGNFGSPAVSNIFSDRNSGNDFFFLDVYYPYLYTHDKTIFVNTKRQFTRLLYINGGSTDDKEENFEVFHTQNVNEKLNFGLKFNTTISHGQYLFQRTKRNSFKLFSSYDGDFYSYDVSINTNNFSTNENGGILNDSLLSDKNYESTGDIPTKFSGSGSSPRDIADVSNTFKNIDLAILNDFDLTNVFFKKDTTSEDSLSSSKKIGLRHLFEFEVNKKIFNDINPMTGILADFYDTAYFNSALTHDSVFYRKLSNTLRFYIREKKIYSFHFDLSGELFKYLFYSQDEAKRLQYPIQNDNGSPFTYRSFESDFRFGSGLNVDPEHLNLNLTGFLYFGGYKRGSFKVDAGFNLLQSKFRKADLSGYAQFSSEKPLYLYNRYYSNYFIWDNNFNQIKKLQLSIKYRYSPNKFESDINYYLLRGQIYFDKNAYPKQYNKNLSLFEFRVFKDFSFWKFRSLNKIAFQYVSDELILGLPNVCFYNSTYFKQRVYFNFTGGEFTTLLGFDMYYDTKYYGYAYMPALSSFYRQLEKKIGGYPVVDIFLNIKLKRALFFFKFEHINSGLLEKNYFSVLHYPRNERMFKVGISWNFYD